MAATNTPSASTAQPGATAPTTNQTVEIKAAEHVADKTTQTAAPVANDKVPSIETDQAPTKSKQARKAKAPTEVQEPVEIAQNALEKAPAREGSGEPSNTVDAEVMRTLAYLRAMRLRRVEELAQQNATISARSEGPHATEREPKNPRRLPSDMQERYLPVGDKMYFREKRDVVAFVDKGDKLHTPSKDPALAVTLVRIADERGWNDIRVKGTEEFRREVWLEASARGITVDGYKPAPIDKAELEIRARQFEARNAVEQRAATFKTRSPADGVAIAPELAGAYTAAAATETFARENIADEAVRREVIERTRQHIAADVAAGKTFSNLQVRVPEGAIKEHGEAPYKFDKAEKSSYYVTIAGRDGRDRTVWGQDLKRALAEARVAQGDYVRLQVEDKRGVKVQANIRDGQNRVVGQETIDANRNQWKVEVIDRAPEIKQGQQRSRGR